MKNNKFYHIRDIKKAFDDLTNARPQKIYYKLDDFMSAFKKSVKEKEPKWSFVYNINAIIRSLEVYLSTHKVYTISEYKETEICEIIGVRKLTMHNLRKKGLIRCFKYDTRTILYHMYDLLEDFQTIRDQNSSD